jgi:uncharacterized protein YbgA (DUF1722 family)/uncharacterized protein YbbK (DUF523 family)
MIEIDRQELSRPLLGIGSCLAGNAVRYNGLANAPNRHVKLICKHFDTRHFCPEVAAGLGVPRPPIHVVGDPGSVRILDVATHEQDYTQRIASHAREVLDSAPDMSGYILVKGSPSCGYERVKRFNSQGNLVAQDQQGVFAAALGAADPLLPLEDDGRLNDPILRESFVTRVVAYHHWKKLRAEDLSPHKLIQFYSRYKYLVMAHHLPAYKALGRLLANAGKQDPDALAGEFIVTFMHALKQRASCRSHSNVLFHLAGYLKKTISAAERQRLSQLIEQYRLGHVPLIDPVTLLRHHFADRPDPYIEQQVFLSPYPDELKLRNFV